MLDNEFLRKLGIKEELLPAPGPSGDAVNEKESTEDLPPAGEFMDLSEEEIKRLLLDW